MPNMTLYHIAPSRSSVVHWLLEEIGQPYELKVLDRQNGENRRAEFLAINPMGKVPALRHGDVIITEACAILCYLADAFPQARLNVQVGDARRGPYLKWLFFAPGSLEPAIMDRAFPRTEQAPRAAIGYGDFETVMDVLAKAVATGPYLLGEQFTAADIAIGSNLRWGMLWKFIPPRPEFTAYVEQLTARPAFKRADAKDAEIAAQEKKTA
jgi:glutathione S-transferase